VFYKELGISDIRVEVNSIGCKACRPSYRDALVSYLKSKEPELCEDCKKRTDVNPLRVLDCKVPSCSLVVKSAPVITAFLCEDCKVHNNAVLKVLDSSKVVYSVNPLLVRGLDYYSRTVFEFISEQLDGRQNALGGGGRYDELSTHLGEKPVPSVGYAGGVERTVLFMGEQAAASIDAYIAMLDEDTLKAYAPVIFEAKKQAIGSKVCFIDEDFKTRDIKKHLSKADKLGSRYALIAGSQELSAGLVIIKDLLLKKEEHIKIDLNNVESSAGSIVRRLLEEKNS
jgi:histidyl-tRNA synthetase